jgi:FAD/FMN-containing dehydrogenase
VRRVGNYGRTWSFRPATLHAPTSAEELAAIVRGANTVRVMGARHSWSRGIVTDDALVTLDRMHGVLDVDREGLRITVQAGIRLKDLIRELEARGLALANMGSVAEQSLAGAIATGTHGTGIGHRCLADQMLAFKLIDGRGEERGLDRDHPDFDAVAVGLGAFGVVHEITLRVVPSFQMHAITEPLPFEEAVERLDELAQAHDHLKLWWFAPNQDAIVFRQDHTQEPRNDSDLQRWFKDEFLAVLTYRPILFLQRLWRDPLVRWTNRVLGGAYAQRFERICKGPVAFLTPSPPVHRETEWAFDYADARSLLRTYRALVLGSGHTYNFVQEIRVTGADPYWLSPSYGRDSIWLSLYNIDRSQRWDDQLTRFEGWARDRGGRPHWGKEAAFDPAYTRAQFERFDDFLALRASYDPEGRFLNAWLARVLGLEPPARA